MSWVEYKNLLEEINNSIIVILVHLFIMLFTFTIKIQYLHKYYVHIFGFTGRKINNTCY